MGKTKNKSERENKTRGNWGERGWLLWRKRSPVSSPFFFRFPFRARFLRRSTTISEPGTGNPSYRNEKKKTEEDVPFGLPFEKKENVSAQTRIVAIHRNCNGKVH